MALKAVIFDLDGTLLDTLQDIAISANKVIQEFGKVPIELHSYRYLVGEGSQRLFEKVLEGYDAKQIQTAMQRFEYHYDKQYSVHTKAYDGISKVLSYLQTSGISINVLSNKPHAFTKKSVYKYLGKWKFDKVYGIRENIPRKPDPKSTFEIMDYLNVSADEVIFVGDTLVDMITAKNAGMQAIGVLWGFRQKEELLSNGASYTCEDPTDLIHLFGKLIKGDY